MCVYEYFNNIEKKVERCGCKKDVKMFHVHYCKLFIINYFNELQY